MSLFGAVRLLLVAGDAHGPDRLGFGSPPPIRASVRAARGPEAAFREEIATFVAARTLENANPPDGIQIDTTAVSPVVRFAGHPR
jgi:hypothetical protein